KHFSHRTANAVIAEFEAIVRESFQVWLPIAADYELARTLLATYESNLRGGDALHLAIARNRRAEKIVTLDVGLLKAAKRLEIPAARGIR
ncbi:MAG: type II toxin-antitoxin system VapC family toxin, partial [Rhodocyclaceae bacterium]|nr:type II toxin-antitoxin system VapC family toxin [Rhodocyclaceae bacterium]